MVASSLKAASQLASSYIVLVLLDRLTSFRGCTVPSWLVYIGFLKTTSNPSASLDRSRQRLPTAVPMGMDPVEGREDRETFLEEGGGVTM